MAATYGYVRSVIGGTYVSKNDATLFDKYIELGNYSAARAILDKYNIQHY